MKRNSGFIKRDLWPANSPDLNSVDYKIWVVMQEGVLSVAHDELMHRLIEAWSGIEQSVIDQASVARSSY